VFESIKDEPLPDNGVVTLDDDPGFGVELDRDIISPYQ